MDRPEAKQCSVHDESHFVIYLYWRAGKERLGLSYTYLGSLNPEGGAGDTESRASSVAVI